MKFEAFKNIVEQIMIKLHLKLKAGLIRLKPAIDAQVSKAKKLKTQVSK
jgi:hypothetical protein